jgi:hypothetical protein
MAEKLGDRRVAKKAKRALAQRKYAAKLKKKGAPRTDDIARALLKALQDVFAARPPQAEFREKWRPLLLATKKHLVAREFKADEAEFCIKRALGFEKPRR